MFSMNLVPEGCEAAVTHTTEDTRWNKRTWFRPNKPLKCLMFARGFERNLYMHSYEGDVVGVVILNRKYETDEDEILGGDGDRDSSVSWVQEGSPSHLTGTWHTHCLKKTGIFRDLREFPARKVDVMLGTALPTFEGNPFFFALLHESETLDIPRITKAHLRKELEGMKSVLSEGNERINQMEELLKLL